MGKQAIHIYRYESVHMFLERKQAQLGQHVKKDTSQPCRTPHALRNGPLADG